MVQHVKKDRLDHNEAIKKARSSVTTSLESASTPASGLSVRQNQILSMQRSHGNGFVSRMLAARTSQTPARPVGGKGADTFQEILFQAHQANGGAVVAGAVTADSGTVQTRSLPERFIGGKTDQLDYQTDVTRFTQVDDPEAILTNQQGVLSTPQRSMDRAVIPRDDTPDPSVVVDPPAVLDNTLTKSTVSEPTPSPSGGYNWVVQWELSDASPAGGWIIQGVNVTGNITDPSGAVPTGWEPFVPYWEAWQVHPGQSITTYAETGDVFDDTFANASFAANTTGALLEAGTAVFYEGISLPDSFSVHQNHPAGMLPIAISDPGLSGGTSPLAHSLDATWDGSSGDTDTTLVTQ